MELWIIWLGIIIILSIIEILTVNIVSIWFIVSSILALVLAFFVDSFYIQFLVFGIVGIVLMLTTRPLVIKYLQPKNVKTNLDRVLGMTGIVTEEIKKNVIGEVKVDGKLWSAVSDKKIAVGEEVTVLEIDGVKLKVRKEDE
ncbi:MAG: NfeD family protein [Bacilli bacterium]|nr:NfeD family protein [Bacilli bacterium]